jgi:hypothetical protein
VNIITNKTTGQMVEWEGTIEAFNAASDPAQVGQWELVGPLAGAVPVMLPQEPTAPVWPLLPATDAALPNPIPVVVSTATLPSSEPATAAPTPAAAPAAPAAIETGAQ